MTRRSREAPAHPRSSHLAEVLRLRLVEGQSVRAISRRLKLGRKTVRKLLGEGPPAPPVAPPPRGSVVDLYDAEIRRLLSETPDTSAAA